MDLLKLITLYINMGPVSEFMLVSFIFATSAAIYFVPAAVNKLNFQTIKSENNGFLVNLVRGFLAICLLIAAVLHPDSPLNVSTPGFVRCMSVLLAVYFYYVLFFAVGHFLRKRYGRPHVYQGKKEMVDTYQSRGLILSARIVLTAILIIIVANSIEADDLFRTSGLIAALLLVIGLSQSAWAPDYISGLVILYSEMYKEGDTVKLLDGDQPIFGEIYRIKVFHTEILSFANNHRVLIKNTRMRDYTIHNLSKFASAKGLREKLSFKIGYDTPEKQVQAMFKSAFKAISRDHSIPIERHHAPEIRVQDTGDHAVEWSIYYYTKETRKVLGTRQAIIETILKTSKTFNISLATPLTHQMDVGESPMQQPPPNFTVGSRHVSYGRNFSIPVFSE